MTTAEGKKTKERRSDGEPPWPDGVTGKLYYKIGEACRITGLPAHVLRFWEKQFQQLNPNKTQSGHRLYRKSDILVALQIKELLYERKFTIKGARELLDEGASLPHPVSATSKVQPAADEGARLGRLKEGLLKLKAKLEEET